MAEWGMAKTFVGCFRSSRAKTTLDEEPGQTLRRSEDTSWKVPVANVCRCLFDRCFRNRLLVLGCNSHSII